MRPSSWVPPAVWMVVIFWLSSGSFSSERTGSTLAAVLAWTAPWLTSGDVALANWIARKLTHLSVYAILALLWLRAFLRDTALTRSGAAAGAFAISVAWAGLDESRQLFETSRSGALSDVALDAVGSAVGLGVAHRGPVCAARRLGLGLLWVAAVGGAALLALNLAAGVPSGALWFTAPAAALILVARRWCARHLRSPAGRTPAGP
jgi:VanZ family protein